MNEQTNEQTTAQTQPLIKEDFIGEDKTEVSLGKFKDVNALQSAYKALQTEFTKRCQRIKELENALNKDKEEIKAEVPPTLSEVCDIDKGKVTGITQEEKDEILKTYLKDLLLSKQQAIVLDKEGVGIKTPTSKPKSFAEAGEYAKELFTK